MNPIVDAFIVDRVPENNKCLPPIKERCKGIQYGRGPGGRCSLPRPLTEISLNGRVLRGECWRARRLGWSKLFGYVGGAEPPGASLGPKSATRLMEVFEGGG